MKFPILLVVFDGQIKQHLSKRYQKTGYMILTGGTSSSRDSGIRLWSGIFGSWLGLNSSGSCIGLISIPSNWGVGEVEKHIMVYAFHSEGAGL